MATLNSFSALVGAGEQVKSAAKKKAKKPASARPESAHADTNGVANGIHNLKLASDDAKVMDILEATSTLEKSAREAKSHAEKCRLWRDWIKQVSRAGRSLRFRRALFVPSRIAPLTRRPNTAPAPQATDRAVKPIKNGDEEVDFRQVRRVGVCCCSR